MRRHNKPKKPKQYDGNVRRLLAKESSKRKKLEALGIDYDFPGYVRIPFYSPLPPDCNCIHSPSHHRRYKYVQRENMLSLIEFHKYIALFSKRVCCQLHDGRLKSNSSAFAGSVQESSLCVRIPLYTGSTALAASWVLSFRFKLT